LRRPLETGLPLSEPRRRTSCRDHRGRTATAKVSMPASGTNC